jgi:hypothetical protein
MGLVLLGSCWGLHFFGISLAFLWYFFGFLPKKYQRNAVENPVISTTQQVPDKYLSSTDVPLLFGCCLAYNQTTTKRQPNNNQTTEGVNKT